MFGEWLRHVLGLVDSRRRSDMAAIDGRLDSIERKQRQVEMRLRLLERQADLRGYTEDN